MAQLKARGEAPNCTPTQENPRVKIEKEEKCSTWECWGGCKIRAREKELWQHGQDCSQKQQYAPRLEVWLCLHWYVQPAVTQMTPIPRWHQLRMRKAAPSPLSTWQIEPEHLDCAQQYSCCVTIPSTMLYKHGRSLSIMSPLLTTLQSTSDSCTHPYSPTVFPQEESSNRKGQSDAPFPSWINPLWQLQRTSKSFSLRSKHKKTGSTEECEWLLPSHQL